MSEGEMREREGERREGRSEVVRERGEREGVRQRRREERGKE